MGARSALALTAHTFQHGTTRDRLQRGLRLLWAGGSGLPIIVLRIIRGFLRITTMPTLRTGFRLLPLAAPSLLEGGTASGDRPSPAPPFRNPTFLSLPPRFSSSPPSGGPARENQATAVGGGKERFGSAGCLVGGTDRVEKPAPPQPTPPRLEWTVSPGSHGTTWGHVYWVDRGEILRPTQDKRWRKRFTGWCSSIKNESAGIEDDQIPS